MSITIVIQANIYQILLILLSRSALCHAGPFSCLALCGEFFLIASQGKDLIVWRSSDLRLFTKFDKGMVLLSFSKL